MAARIEDLGQGTFVKVDGAVCNDIPLPTPRSERALRPTTVATASSALATASTSPFIDQTKPGQLNLDCLQQHRQCAAAFKAVRRTATLIRCDGNWPALVRGFAIHC